MKTITLTRGQFAKVDDEDFERIDAHKWNAYWDKNARTESTESASTSATSPAPSLPLSPTTRQLSVFTAPSR